MRWVLRNFGILQVFALVVIGVVVMYAFVSTVHADGTPILITTIQTGDNYSASDEYIQIANNTADVVDVTNWCLYYASASSTSLGTKLSCLIPTQTGNHIFLPGRSFIVATSNQFHTANPVVFADLYFNGGMSGIGGHVRLVDADGQTLDKVGWGTAISAEGSSPTLAPSTATVLQRKLASTFTYQDTDNNRADFDVTTPAATLSYGAKYELNDICTNIDGFQINVPDGYVEEGSGKCTRDLCSNIDGYQSDIPPNYVSDDLSICYIDLCLNLDGYQSLVPEGMSVDSEGNCGAVDICTNIPGKQTEIPNGFASDDNSMCRWVLQPIVVSELLPNPTGSDTGHEFIELYNPNDQEVNLGGFSILTGLKQQDSFVLDNKVVLPADGYVVLYNDVYSFTLTNTDGQVQLQSPNQLVMSQTDPYSSAGDNAAWALIDDTWQYTTLITPGFANKLPDLTSSSSVSVEPDDTSATLTPCSSGQYRNPDTNRCRKIPDQGSALTPCDEGQERNPTTNRCRSTALTSTEPVPCKAGQERNADTNRCRNITSSTPPKSDYGVLGAQTSSSGHYLTWAIVGVLAIAAGYAIWEWREEIRRFFFKIRSRIRRSE